MCTVVIPVFSRNAHYVGIGVKRRYYNFFIYGTGTQLDSIKITFYLLLCMAKKCSKNGKEADAVLLQEHCTTYKDDFAAFGWPSCAYTVSKVSTSTS